MRKNYKMDEGYTNRLLKEKITYRVCENCGSMPYNLRGTYHAIFCCHCGVKFTEGDEREDIVKGLIAQGYRVHRLKLSTQYFEDVKSGRKNFEIRFNDRSYDVNDILLLEEYDSLDKTYKDGFVVKRVKYTLADTEYVKEGYVALGLEDFSGPGNLMFP